MSVDQKHDPYSSNSEAVRLELSQIDASIRSAALFFVISALLALQNARRLSCNGPMVHRSR